ncbi:unnamed protein product [Acanthoscelides obtectus]|uniref:DDE-1 domain-containing protein n=1 Tax=Acanthoscelides obtectus TaxID=200917 RepID=A0A9P0PQL8_ACAOB|nr:unnamed protein product [Acanthoscelides obtectus]CAK1624426.1 Tigger transposable element-derived protein 2 [Acanthoscelides obtectus]
MKELNLSPEAIFLLDNATGHPLDLASNDNKISVLFLPPNCTPLIQPMDQHFIQAIKLFYRKKLFEKIVESLKDVNLRHVVFSLDEAWNHVGTDLITKSWSKIILPTDIPQGNVYDSDEEDIPLARLTRRIAEPEPKEIENKLEEIMDLGKKLDENLTNEEIEEWLGHDKAISDNLTKADIIQEIEDSGSDSDLDDDSVDMPRSFYLDRRLDAPGVGVS